MTENKHPESILIGGTTVRNLKDGFWIRLPLSVPQGFRGFDCPSHGPRVAKCTAECTFRLFDDRRRDVQSGPPLV